MNALQDWFRPLTFSVGMPTTLRRQSLQLYRRDSDLAPQALFLRRRHGSGASATRADGAIEQHWKPKHQGRTAHGQCESWRHATENLAASPSDTSTLPLPTLTLEWSTAVSRRFALRFFLSEDPGRPSKPPGSHKHSCTQSRTHHDWGRFCFASWQLTCAAGNGQSVTHDHLY